MDLGRSRALGDYRDREGGDEVAEELRAHLRLEAERLGLDGEDHRAGRQAFLEFFRTLTGSRLFALLFFLLITVMGGVLLLLFSEEVLPSGRFPMLMYGVTALFVLMTLVVVVRWVDIWLIRRSNEAGSHLQAYFAVMFSVFSAVPIVVVSLFSLLFFEMGVDRWFSGSVEKAVDSSSEVARAYGEDRLNRIGVSVLETARNIESRSLKTEEDMANVLALGRFDEGLVFLLHPTGEREVVARHGVTFLLENEEIDGEALENAKEGEPVIFSDLEKNRVQALVKLHDPRQLFLYGVDYMDESAIEFVKKTEEAVSSYKALKESQDRVKVTLIGAFGAFSLMLVMSSVWLGLNFARWLVQPLSQLLLATGMVSQGNLSVRVREEGSSLGEIKNLMRAFNHMTERLYSQQRELMEANDVLEERQHLMEGVLRGVSAGVMGVDREGRVSLLNRQAERLLGEEVEVGKSFGEKKDELSLLVLGTLNRLYFDEEVLPFEKTLKRDDGKGGKVLQVRMYPSLMEGLEEEGSRELVALVVTIDDITDLVAAEREAAWSDVARRIAHEIKNPLTPIQLSAERLRRRYEKELSSGRETFEECIETIIHQVDSIRSMVDEFSSFSRMPHPVLRKVSLVEISRRAVFLQSHGDKLNSYDMEVEEGLDDVLSVDSRLLGQVMTNVLLNGCESIERRRGSEESGEFEGRIVVRLRGEGDVGVVIEVEDNGCGWDSEVSGGTMDRFMDAYTTSSEGGRGLGLSIVRRIMEQHGGKIKLSEVPGGGACIHLIFYREEVGEELQ
jgi:two-component system nitrogen regulation sensor histidine kinase NtrY